MLKEILKERDLLPVLKMGDGSEVNKENWHKRRREMRELLEEYSYGITPPAPSEAMQPSRLWGEIIGEENPERFAGKVLEEKINVTFETAKGECTIPFTLLVPKNKEPMPVFLLLMFDSEIPNRFLPAAEITDRGYAVAAVCYKDIMNDNLCGDFNNDIAKVFGTTRNRFGNEWGKIGMWAYGASRILDYLLTREDIDAEKTIVIGHSRLGKTALWAGAQDERFWGVISNNSGYGGAATSKFGNRYEQIEDFLYHGSWDWYCENFKKLRGREDEKPYDQSFLLALVAPRYLCVGSAEEDPGADHDSEFITTLWASSAWELLGKKGLITPDNMPKPGDRLHEGCIGYHLREGRHCLSREDWNIYMDFFDKKLKEENNK